MRKKTYTYWLEISSNNLNIEYGINDRLAFYDYDGGSHYFEAPIDHFLFKGKNSAYIRFSPETPKSSAVSSAHSVANLKVVIQVMNISTRHLQKLELFEASVNPVTNEVEVLTAPDQNRDPLNAKDLSRLLKRLPDFPEQGKTKGLEVDFWVQDEFPLHFYPAGHEMKITPQLEQGAQQAMYDLLKLYQSRDVGGITGAYSRSWEHMAKSFEYGSSSSDFATGVDVSSDINRSKFQFVLDFSKSKLRLDGYGKLLGYHPPPLMAKESDGFVAMEFPVFFMLDSKQGLNISG